MKLKLYRAARMADAMASVRAELGPDGLILSSRRVAEGIEITAAIETVAADPVERAQRERRLAYHGAPPLLLGTLLDGALADCLAQTFRFAPIELGAGSLPVLFAGPPGAGKTLTVARLATRLVMGGASPVIITADGRRAGAAEQLAAFTRLLGLDLLVASHPAALARALASRAAAGPVLIDTPGGNAFDPAQRDELRMLREAAHARIAFVMPAGIAPAEAADMASAYAAAGAEFLVATRMDVARRFGCVLAAAGSGLALAEAGIGAGAADGLVPLTAAFLAGRLLDMPHDQEMPRDARN